jgi:hypothetical protein
MVLLRSIYVATATVLLGAQSVAAAPVAAAAAAPDLGSDISSGFQEAGDKIKSVLERCVLDDPTSCGSGNVKREAGISDLGQDIKGSFEDAGDKIRDAFTKREPEAGIASDIKGGFEDAGQKIKDAFTKRRVVDDPTPCESEIS